MPLVPADPRRSPPAMPPIRAFQSARGRWTAAKSAVVAIRPYNPKRKPPLIVKYLKVSKVAGKEQIKKLKFTLVQYNHSKIWKANLSWSSGKWERAKTRDDCFIVLMLIFQRAGVIGLNVALVLAEKGYGRHSTIIAEHLPGDTSINYTSPWFVEQLLLPVHIYKRLIGVQGRCKFLCYFCKRPECIAMG